MSNRLACPRSDLVDHTNFFRTKFDIFSEDSKTSYYMSPSRDSRSGTEVRPCSAARSYPKHGNVRQGLLSIVVVHCPQSGENASSLLSVFYLFTIFGGGGGVTYPGVWAVDSITVELPGYSIMMSTTAVIKVSHQNLFCFISAPCIWCVWRSNHDIYFFV